jgi:hypothetical protein
MSITLDSALRTAQDRATHHPIIEIKNKIEDFFPISGTSLQNGVDEKSAAIITRSAGGVIGATIYNYTKIRIIISDNNSESIKINVILDAITDLGAAAGVTNIDCCSILELADGTIGLVYLCYDSTDRYLRRSILSTDGAVVSNGLIATYAILLFLPSSISCILLNSGTFLLSYIIIDMVDLIAGYPIYIRTSADFLTWSAESSASIAGIGANIKYNVNLMQIDNNDVFMFFDYANIAGVTNCYYSISADDGANWGAAVVITDYTTTALFGRNPKGMLSSVGEIYCTYNEQKNAMFIDTTTTGWPGGVADVTSVHIYNDCAYMICVNSAAGADALIAIIEVDISTWAITDSWTTADFNSVFANTDCIWKIKGHCNNYIVIANTLGQVAILNLEIDVITNYYFFSNSTYSITANTDWTPTAMSGVSVDTLAGAVIRDGFIYCVFFKNDATTRPVEIVKIDLNQTEATWKTSVVYAGSNIFNEDELSLVVDYKGFNFQIFEEADIAIISVENSGDEDINGRLIIFDISSETWIVWQSYIGEDDDDGVLPWGGVLHAAYYNNSLYCIFPYADDFDEREGIISLDLTTGLSSDIEPNWTTDYDNYKFKKILKITNTEMIVSGDYGITRYNFITNNWILKNNNTVPGLTPDANNANFFDLAYYSSDNIIFSGKLYNAAAWEGLVATATEKNFSTIKSKIIATTWNVFDTTVKSANSVGFTGAVYDGRYVYFAPHHTGSAYNGQITRYDTKDGTFKEPRSWMVYDTAAKVHNSSRGFQDAVYDGSRYIYYVPYHDSAIYSGQVTRYDTWYAFDMINPYTVFDMRIHVNSNAKGFVGAVFDGRYVYFVPYYNGAAQHGYVARYDTTADFELANSYAVFNSATVHANSKGFRGAVFDGRYVYFVPYKNGANYHGQVTRYDTTLSFTDVGSWAVYDTTAVHVNSKGFQGAVFDGQYVYFVPQYTGAAYHGQVTRYDTTLTFTDAGSWAVYDTTAVHANSKGFFGAVFDGQYVYFVPNNNGAYHGQVTRYDTTGTFTDVGSWAVYDTTAVHAGSKGFQNAVFDGQYVYFVPIHNGTAYHGQVTRYNTTGVFTDAASWSLGVEFGFSDGLFDSDMTPSADANGFSSIYTTTKNGVNSVNFQNNRSNLFDFGKYIATDYDIIIERSIDNKPARFSFTLAPGHFFDEDNSSSLLRNYLKKGTKLTLRLGEKISGTDYWQAQGTFYVKNKNISYQKGTMPLMTVFCEDSRSLLEDMELITTAYYNGEYPETIIADILDSKGIVDGVSIDYMDNRAPLYCNWTDSKIMDILLDLTNRYGYFLRCDNDNIFRVKKIDEHASVDHTYTNRNTIIEYSSDNNFSDYVNRVIVRGEERISRQIIYPEKEIQIKTGTIGWWQGTEEIKIPYSDDYSLQCLSPYPIMNYLSGNFLFGGGALRWELTADASNTFCTLKIIAPVLMTQLVAALGVALATNWIPVIGGAISAIGFVEIFNILATVSNWSATIMAQPIGYVRAAVEGIADDADFQADIDRIVTRTFEDCLAYTAAQCQAIADHEMMITRLQRKRVIVNKIAHLQDEEGDIIQIVHPISLENVKILITNITRRIRIPQKTDQSSGMFDLVEGWVV